jgi:hypothetical protein
MAKNRRSTKKHNNSQGILKRKALEAQNTREGLAQLDNVFNLVNDILGELLGEVTQTKDGRSKNLTRTRNVPPKCNKQVTSKQQTRSFLTSIN